VSGFLFDTSALLILGLEEELVARPALPVLMGRARFVSQVCAIEIAIKHSIGKLPLPPPFQASFVHAFNSMVEAFSAETLAIDLRHVDVLSRLPRLHRDPFDRLIISQALSENLTVVTRDRVFSLYPGLDVHEI
jgi:PIN domain nuclease of toxin-antitoxin system